MVKSYCKIRGLCGRLPNIKALWPAAQLWRLCGLRPNIEDFVASGPTLKALWLATQRWRLCGLRAWRFCRLWPTLKALCPVAVLPVLTFGFSALNSNSSSLLKHKYTRKNTQNKITKENKKVKLYFEQINGVQYIVHSLLCKL